jgi:S-adenosylmethionine:tRNA ribosyltransferase-isomerase
VPGILREGDLLVMNDTRVTALRLYGRKSTGGAIEALLLQPTGRAGEFVALMRPGRRLPPGAAVAFEGGLEATVREDLGGGRRRLAFAEAEDLDARLMAIGEAPLPPYVHTRLKDPERYQTIYARQPGSAAAPTAGLHFTDEILTQLKASGVETAFVTLDIGMDTFRPVKAERIAEHRMHGERCAAPPETAQAIARCQGRIVAVGTTVVRTLESLAQGPRQIAPRDVTTELFVRPGFECQVVDGMFTNFHMPRTSMLMMIAALAGKERVLRAYAEAVSLRYRFLSFGDSMLIL